MRLLIILSFAVFCTGVEVPIREIDATQDGSSLEAGTTREVDMAYFLPRNTIPYHYFIHLTTDVQNNDPVFKAVTEIYFEVVEPTQVITMHLQELSIATVELSRIPANFGNPIFIDNPLYSVNSKIEHVEFTSQGVLPLGKYILKVTYTGTMRNYQSGYFMSTYRDANNKIHYVGSSHFQATLARRVFPCYDEPDLKATFTLWITHHFSYNAISNANIDSIYPDTENREYRITKFKTTPKMSTYLLAFAVTDFETFPLERQQIVARPGSADDVEVGLKASSTIVSAMDLHTGVRYYDFMPKLTHIAVPDRGTGAMENWGLITYGEPSILFNPAVNSYRNRKHVITVIAHELAHQWFGNLVSPRWWEYIWLSEGFAKLYEYLAADLAYPDLEYWELFNVEVVHRALDQDASETIRAMNTPASSQEDVHALFDIIAYQKSGSVINMFRQIIGDFNWRQGLHDYLTKLQLASAIPDDLYTSLQGVIEGKNIIPKSFSLKQLMESWTNAAGYPVVNVRRLYKTGEILISQERFLANKRLPNDHIWYIPYSYVDKVGQTKTDWLTSKAVKLSTGTPDNQWIIFNHEQLGYYRVNYDERNWQHLTATLLTNPDQIHRANRAQLIDDAFNLARADRLDMSIALKLLMYLHHETEYAPWAAANNVLNYFHNKLQGTVHYTAFANFVGESISEIYKTLQVDTVSTEETTLHKYLKQTITNWACRIGNADCLDKTYAALKREVEEGIMVHPDVAAVVYCHGLRHGTNKELSYLVPKMTNSKNEAQRTDLITALGCTKDAESVRALLTVIKLPTVNYLSTERSQLVDAIVAGTGPEGIAAMVGHLMDVTNAKQLLSILGDGTFRGMILNIASRTNNDTERQSLQQLFKTLEGVVISKETIEEAQAKMKANADWFTSLEGLVAVEFYETYSNAVPFGQ